MGNLKGSHASTVYISIVYSAASFHCSYSGFDDSEVDCGRMEERKPAVKRTEFMNENRKKGLRQ